MTWPLVLRTCGYCGGSRMTFAYRPTCKPHRDLPKLDPGPGDPPGFTPRVRMRWRDRGAVCRAVNRAAGREPGEGAS